MLMNNFIALKPKWAFVIYIILDILCIGMGMGVPIVCIMLGFLVGWYIVRNVTITPMDFRLVFRKSWQYSLITSAVTMFGMLILWGPFAANLLNPGYELANSGIPMILYEPFPSFIGWIVLMIVISPFLQLLTTLFGAYLTLLRWLDVEKVSIMPQTQ